MEIAQTTFDYGVLDIGTREFVKNKELSIKARTSQTIWENGRDLLEVKERLEHGQFQKWVEANFPWSIDTAERFIQVAQQFNNPQIADFGFTKSVLYLLAAPSTPETARQEAIERAEAGESLSHKQAQELIEAHKAIADKEARIGNLENQIQSLQAKLPTTDVIEKIQELTIALEAERNKPAIEVEKIVEVVPDDYEDTKEALSKTQETLRTTKSQVKYSRPSHVKCELTKIIEGWGDYFFYAFATGDETGFIQWVLCRLNVFRVWFNRYLATHKGRMPGVLQENGDKSSDFYAYKLRDMPQDFIVASSWESGDLPSCVELPHVEMRVGTN